MINTLLKKLWGDGTPLGLSPHALRQANEFLSSHSLGEILPYESYEEETRLFWNRKSVGFVVEAVPVIGADHTDLPQLTGLFQHSMPLGSNLQCLLMASSRVASRIEHWEVLRQGRGEILETLAQERGQYLRELAKTHGIRNFRLYLSYSQPREDATSQTVNQILAFREQLETTLRGMGTHTMVFQASDLLRSLDEILNPSDRLDTPELDWNPNDVLSHQIMSSSTRMRVEPQQLVVGEREKIIRLYTARRFPSRWHQAHMTLLIGDPFDTFLRLNCPFFISYGIHICKEGSLKSVMLTKAANVERQACSPLGQWFPSLKKEMEDWNYVKQKFEEHQRVVRTRYQVGLIAGPDQFFKEEQTLLNLYRSNRWELTLDGSLQLPSLLSALPMTWGEGAQKDGQYFGRNKTTLSHEPANLMPLQGEWKGTQTPGMVLMGRRGQIGFWNPFDNPSGNFNTCVVGRSGSGKSVFMQELMTSCLGLGARVFVLDVGRSFEKTVKLLGGTYLEFSQKSPLCVNPFSTLPQEGGEAREDFMGMLKPVLSLMAAPKKGTDDLEDSYLLQAAHYAADTHGQQATITDVATFLLNHTDERARTLGERLFPFTVKGPYGRFFNGPATMDLSASMVVVELEELKERKDLQAVIVQMVIMQITNSVYLGDRKTHSFLILDEAWDMLRGKHLKEFIETAARRMRKYKGGLVVGTQSVNDFYVNEGAQAVFDQSDWVCLLSQKAESIDQLKRYEKLSLNPYMERLLRSLKTEQGKYAEVMVTGPDGYCVGRLMLDPFSKILYSTKAEEFAAVLQLQSQGLTLKDAITHVAKGERGV